MKYVVDTNALILNPDIIDEYKAVIISEIVLSELDRIKIESGERGQGARRAVRKLMDAKNVEYDLLDFRYNIEDFVPDKAIIGCAKRHKATLVTGDYLMCVRGKAEGLDVINIFGKTMGKPDYSGYIELHLEDEEVAAYYEGRNLERFNGLEVYPNQYVLLMSNSDNKVIDLLKVTPDYDFVKVKTMKLESEQMGKLIPKDVYQSMAIDSLVNNQMTILKGKAGSGKSLIALSFAFQAIEKGIGKGKDKDKYDKIIFFVNPVPTKGAAKLGFLPGTQDQKLLDSSAGKMLSSKLGGRDAIERLIADGKVQCLPFSDIRGYDTTGMKAIIHILESQNLDIDLLKLAIQRVSDDCKLIIDGDNKQQVDDISYAGMNNGMRRASEIFRGEDCFGEVELPNIYRSNLARIADKM